MVSCDGCLKHNLLIDPTWTNTMHLKRTWETNEERLAEGIHRLMPDIHLEAPAALRGNALRAHASEMKELLLAPFLPLAGVLRNCHHRPTLSELYRKEFRDWPTDDRRLRFVFNGTRLNDEPEHHIAILCIILGKQRAAIKKLYRNQEVLLLIISVINFNQTNPTGPSCCFASCSRKLTSNKWRFSTSLEQTSFWPKIPIKHWWHPSWKYQALPKGLFPKPSR